MTNHSPKAVLTSSAAAVTTSTNNAPGNSGSHDNVMAAGVGGGVRGGAGGDQFASNLIAGGSSNSIHHKSDAAREGKTINAAAAAVAPVRCTSKESDAERVLGSGAVASQFPSGNSEASRNIIPGTATVKDRLSIDGVVKGEGGLIPSSNKVSASV